MIGWVLAADFLRKVVVDILHVENFVIEGDMTRNIFPTHPTLTV